MNRPFLSRCCRALILALLLSALLLPFSVHADVLVGRYHGEVCWSFDADTGELRIYGDCGDESPEWRALADGIREVYVAPSVTSLPQDALRGCYRLKSLTLPETVRSLGAGALADCTALTEVTLPASLVHIGQNAFSGCGRLGSLVYAGSSEQWEALSANPAEGNEALFRLVPRYTRPTHRLHISYIDSQSGERLAPDVVRVMTERASAVIRSPRIDRYTTLQEVISIQGILSDTSVTVYYHRTESPLKLRYEDTRGNELLPEQIMTIPYGTALTIEAPRVAGFTANEPTTVALPPLYSEHTHTFYYTPVPLSLTVRCIDAEGQALREPLTLDGLAFGEDYCITPPEIAGYVPEVSELRGERLTESGELWVRYTPILHTVTLLCTDQAGNELREPQVMPVRHGEAFEVAAPEIAGYAPQRTARRIDAVLAPQALRFCYEPIRHLLLVRHEDENGQLLQQTSEYLPSGDSYLCEPLPIKGYAADAPLRGQMPDGALTLTLRYRAVEPTSEDSGTKGGAFSTLGWWLLATTPIVLGLLLAAFALGKRRLKMKK